MANTYFDFGKAVDLVDKDQPEQLLEHLSQHPKDMLAPHAEGILVQAGTRGYTSMVRALVHYFEQHNMLSPQEYFCFLGSTAAYHERACFFEVFDHIKEKLEHFGPGSFNAYERALRGCNPWAVKALKAYCSDDDIRVAFWRALYWAEESKKSDQTYLEAMVQGFPIDRAEPFWHDVGRLKSEGMGAQRDFFRIADDFWMDDEMAKILADWPECVDLGGARLKAYVSQMDLLGEVGGDLGGREIEERSGAGGESYGVRRVGVVKRI